MTNYIGATLLCILLFILGCKNTDNQPDIVWYRSQVSSLYDYDNGNYIVGLGILSRGFFLYKDEKNYHQLLKALKKSYHSKKTIEVGYIPDKNSKSRIVKIK